MNKFLKFGISTLFAVLLVACGPEPKAEFQQVTSLDQEFAPKLTAVQNKITEAQSTKDKTAITGAFNEYFVLVEQAINTYNGLNIKDAEVKAFKDNVVKLLKETLDFTKEVSSLVVAPESLTPEMQQKIAQRQTEIMANAEAIQKQQTELTQKFSEAKK